MWTPWNSSPPAACKRDTSRSACKWRNDSIRKSCSSNNYKIILDAHRNMNRPVTFWYTKDQPIFENTDDMADTRIDVARIPAGSDTPPCLKISHNTFETMEKANWEFLRLSLPVICQSIFISESEKLRRWQEIKMRQNKLLSEQMEQAQQVPSAHIEQIMKSGFSMSDIKGKIFIYKVFFFFLI